MGDSNLRTQCKTKWEQVFRRQRRMKREAHTVCVASVSGTSQLPRSGLYGEIYGTALTDFSGELQAQWKQEKEEVQEWLNSYYQRATAYGVPTQWALKLGEAARAIRELADSWNADLVVLGRRGHRGLAEVVLGSVSNHVIHHAPCSVLVVQGINPTVVDTPEAATQAKNQ